MGSLISSYGRSLSVAPRWCPSPTTLSRYDIRLVIVDRSESGIGPVMKLFTDALKFVRPVFTLGQL